jgi:hypothetical protein
MPGRISVIIFDLDDTPEEALPARASAAESVFKEVGLTSLVGTAFGKCYRGIIIAESMRHLEQEHRLYAGCSNDA